MLLEAGAIRFKPILLTALAAMIGAAVILDRPDLPGPGDLAALRPRLLDAADRAGHPGDLPCPQDLASGTSVRVQHLWRQNRGLLIAFALALLVTVFFAVRLVVHAVYWSRHRDAELAEWMTIGYVAQSYRVERDDLARAVGVEPGSGQRLTIAGIAERTDQSVNEVEAALLAVIRARRAEDAPGEQ